MLKKQNIILPRDIRSINVNLFKEELSSRLNKNRPRSVEDFDMTLSAVLDQFAPLISRRISSRTKAPWFTPEVQQAKRDKRRAERKWRSTGLTIHKDIYKQKQKEYYTLIKDQKKRHYNDKITDCESTKQLFKVCNELLGKSKIEAYPTNNCKNELPNMFSSYFNDKVS